MASGRPNKIGRYDIIDVIGRGGMGIVYKAVDPTLGRSVAIKMMTGAYAEHPDLLKRFFREAQSTASLQHPNIVTLYELGDEGGSPYIVMEFLEGESLDAIISSRRQMTLLDKISLIVEVCRGLSYAHNRGIVHRDIKPGNIMVCKDGVVKIVDFGLAHLGDMNVTRTGEIMGSISYMAPEQINGEAVDARSDIFSTGVVLYQFFTYSLPFDGGSTAATLLKIIHESPPPLKNFLTVYPAELDSIISKALEKQREQRYNSADELALDLCQLQGQAKQELIATQLQAAAVLLEKSELHKAKDQLLHVLRLDRQNTHANLLLREVQQKIQKEERSEQIRQLRTQAEHEFAEANFESATACVERAIQLDGSNSQLLSLRESIKAAWDKFRKLQQVLKRAEIAHRDGDLALAKQSIEEALELAPDDTTAKTLHRTIQRDWEEQARHRQVENYIEQARHEMAVRNFTSALEILRQADSLDPGAPELRALLESAKTGREQERRRRELEGFQREVEEALNGDNYAKACQKAGEGLQKFPEDRTLQKLKTLAEKQQQVTERKMFVDQQLLSARALLEQGRSEDLIRLLEAAIEKVGPEPRLSSLLSIVRENLERERLELKKNEYLQKAKETIRQKDYRQAIQTLEAAAAELEETPEIQDLLQFAKEEAVAEERRKAVDDATRKAHDLLARREYEQAIQVLENTLRECPDEEVNLILVEARRASIEYQNKLQGTLANAERLLRSHKAIEALHFLEEHSSLVARSAALQQLLQTARRDAERQRNVDEAMAHASQSMSQGDFVAARSVLEECRVSQGPSDDLQQRLDEVISKQAADADAGVRRAISDARMLVMAGEYEAACEKLTAVINRIPFVALSLKTEYQNLQQQASDGLFRQRKLHIENRVTAGELTDAADLLRRTTLQFPARRELLNLENSLREETKRRTDALRVISEAEQCFKKAEWKRGSHLLQELFKAQTVPSIREQVLSTLVKTAQSVLSADWHASEALVQQALTLQPHLMLPGDLRHQLGLKRCEEDVKECIAQAKQMQSKGDHKGAIERISRALQMYPENPKLVELQRAIEDQVRQDREAVVQKFVTSTDRARSTGALQTALTEVERGLFVYPEERKLQNLRAEILDLLQQEKSRHEAAAAKSQGVPAPETTATKLFTAALAGKDTKVSLSNVAGWQPETLLSVEKQLAVFVGPLAKVLVNKAAGKSKNLEELYEILALSVKSEKDRRNFLAHRVQGIQSGMITKAVIDPITDGASLPDLCSTPFAAGDLERVTRKLARYVGPISAVLVKKAAQRADTLHALYSLLAEHIADAAKRAEFLREGGLT